MKKEPEVRCPSAINGECPVKCAHAENHVRHSVLPHCHAAVGCPACEPVQTKPKNVVALLKSIAHWDLIAQGLEVSRGGENCECCKQCASVGCHSCLIKEAGFLGCRDTPFDKVALFTLTKNQTPKALDAIEAEVEFLISCLPETEQKAFSLENVRPFLRFGDKVWRNGEQVYFIRDLKSTYFEYYNPKTTKTRFDFKENFTLSPPKPKPQLWETLELGQPVVVWDQGVKLVTFFHHYEPKEGFPVKTSGGLKFETVLTYYQNFRLPTRAEAQKLGFDLNRWQWADDETQKGE